MQKKKRRKEIDDDGDGEDDIVYDDVIIHSLTLFHYNYPYARTTRTKYS